MKKRDCILCAPLARRDSERPEPPQHTIITEKVVFVQAAEKTAVVFPFAVFLSEHLDRAAAAKKRIESNRSRFRAAARRFACAQVQKRARRRSQRRQRSFHNFIFARPPPERSINLLPRGCRSWLPFARSEST